METERNIVDARPKLERRRKADLDRLNERANRLEQEGKLDEAAACRRELFKGTAAAYERNPCQETLKEITLVCSPLASLYGKMGQHEKALRFFEKSLKLDQVLMDKFPGSEHRRMLAADYLQVANQLWVLERLKEAGRLCRRGIQLAESLLTEEPGELAEELLFRGCQLAVWIFSAAGFRIEATCFCRRAIRLIAARGRGAPQPSGRYQLGKLLDQLGGILKDRGKQSASAACYLSALKLFEGLSEERPDRTRTPPRRLPRRHRRPLQPAGPGREDHGIALKIGKSMLEVAWSACRIRASTTGFKVNLNFADSYFIGLPNRGRGR
jgi:tetratricopeptide (TPR) repeat protein